MLVAGRNVLVISPLDSVALVDVQAPGTLHSGGAGTVAAEAPAGASANAAATETTVLNFMSAERGKARCSLGRVPVTPQLDQASLTLHGRIADALGQPPAVSARAGRARPRRRGARSLRRRCSKGRVTFGESPAA